jgi:hypothetical protein
LIFGTRGARGAYSEAFLTNFEDEVANFHHSVHTSTATNVTTSEERAMGLVQIEQSELDTLRKERDDARAEKLPRRRPPPSRPLRRRPPPSRPRPRRPPRWPPRPPRRPPRATEKNEELAKAELKDPPGFAGRRLHRQARRFTVKAKLTEQAGSCSDEEWDSRLKELEEVTAIKRDAKKDGTETPAAEGEGETFGREELARLGGGLGGDGRPPDRRALRVERERRRLARLGFKPVKAKS